MRVMNRHRAALAVVGVLVLAALWLMFVSPVRGGGVTYEVNSTADGAPGACDAMDCTIREAIIAANASMGLDTITFASAVFPANSPAMISPATVLPASTDAAGLEIDGSGAGVIIDGSSLAGDLDGLSFHSSTGVALEGVVVRSLTVQNFPRDGIRACGGDVILCDGELRDTLIEDVSAIGNGERGISLNGLPNRSSSVADSTVSGNGGNGLNMNGGSNGNLEDGLVTNVTATGNDGRGINLNGENNIRSTVEDSTGNGNMFAGININAGGVTTDPTVSGSTATGNTGDGIVLNAGDPGSSGATVTENTSTGNSADGLTTDVPGNYAGNTLSNNGDAGFTARELGIVVEDNVISDNAAHGIDGHSGGEMTITGNTISGNMSPASAIRVPGVNNVISGNEITGNIGDGIDNGFSSSGSTTVTDNVITDNGGDGVALGPDGNHVVEGNLVARSGSDGIRAPGPGNAISGNSTLENIADGIQINDPATEVHFNRIVGNSVGLVYSGVTAVDAENNWWGCNAGPGMPGCDTVSDLVDADPWLVLRFDVPPGSLAENDGFTIFANVTTNSNGADTSGDGTIPDGTEVLFESDIGSVGSDSIVRELDGGVAQTIYIADGGPGTANLSLTLDNQTLTVEVTVTPSTTTTPTGAPTTTATPTGVPTSTPTLSATPTPAPSETPAPKALFGDIDCDGDVDAVDALAILRFVAGLPALVQNEPCEDVGAAGGLFGDLDCDGDIDAVDALAVLRFVAGLSPLSQHEPCPDVGQ